jgi:hypothetical protein
MAFMKAQMGLKFKIKPEDRDDINLKLPILLSKGNLLEDHLEANNDKQHGK